MKNLTNVLLQNVPRYIRDGHDMVKSPNGPWLHQIEVLAALEAAPVPDLVEAGKVLERMKSVCTCNIGSTPCMSEDDCRDAIAAADTIRALIALATAQAAQIAGLEAQLTNTLFEAECEGEDKRDAAYSAAEWQRRAEAAEQLAQERLDHIVAAEAKVAELEAQIVAEKEENRWAYIQAALDDKQTDAEAEAATLRAGVERLRGAVEQIDQWADAYPLEVFPEPDFAKADEVLKAAGLSLSAISASNMRHVIEGVKAITRATLEGKNV